VSGHPAFRWRWLGAGLLAGAAVTGALVVLVARLAAALPPWRLPAVLAVGICLGAWDIAGRHAFTFPWRQTYQGATSYAGPRVGLLTQGFDVGLGFTTYRTSRLYWVGIFMLAAGPPSVACPVGPLGYVLVLLSSLRKGRDIVVPEHWINRRRRLLGLAGVVVQAVLIAVIAIAR
jgi:hypothetical protein